MVAKPPPPRITLLTAEEQPVIVCLCRVRRQIWRIATIDVASGEVSYGRWLNDHAFPYYSVLSPSGKWLSFAALSAYLVGQPPAMDPVYSYEGAPSWGPLVFVSDSVVQSRYAEFKGSSDGSRPPFAVRDSSVSLDSIVKSIKGLFQPPEKLPFKLHTGEQTWDDKRGWTRRFWTEPDLGVIDDKVRSAVVLVSGELVVAREGLVTCYEPADQPPLAARWTADLRVLTDLEGCPFKP